MSSLWKFPRVPWVHGIPTGMRSVINSHGNWNGHNLLGGRRNENVTVLEISHLTVFIHVSYFAIYKGSIEPTVLLGAFYLCDFYSQNDDFLTFLLRDAMLARYMLSSCVRPSVTNRHCTKRAKRRITVINAIR